MSKESSYSTFFFEDKIKKKEAIPSFPCEEKHVTSHKTLKIKPIRPSQYECFQPPKSCLLGSGAHPRPLGNAYVARACAEFHEMLATDAGVRNDWEHHRMLLELANDRFIVNARMHAWDCWLGDVSSASVATSRAMELALRDGGEQALAAARQHAASATASMLAVRDGWPAQGPHMAPTRSIP